MKEQIAYHTTPISVMANTLAAILEVKDIVGTDEVEQLVRFAYQGEAKQVLLFCPSATGSTVLDHYHELTAKVKNIAPNAMDMVVPYPAEEVTALASMLDGVMVDKANRDLYDRTFDETPEKEPPRSLLTECKGKRRVVCCMPERHPARRLLEHTGAEISTAASDMDAVSQAIECLRKNCYDLVIVLATEFDDMMHAVKLYGKRTDAAMEHHVTEFELLCDAAQVYTGANTFVGFCPLHGCHKDILRGGAHHSHRADDLNVTHYYGVVNSLKGKY